MEHTVLQWCIAPVASTVYTLFNGILSYQNSDGDGQYLPLQCFSVSFLRMAEEDDCIVAFQMHIHSTLISWCTSACVQLNHSCPRPINWKGGTSESKRPHFNVAESHVLLKGVRLHYASIVGNFNSTKSEKGLTKILKKKRKVIWVEIPAECEWYDVWQEEDFGASGILMEDFKREGHGNKGVY